MREGERGSGRFKRVSRDEALTTVADAVIDTIKLEGSESVVFEETTEGGLICWASYLRFASMIGAISLDGNGLINDFLIGQYLTFGKYSMASSVDDTFHSKLILIWHLNRLRRASRTTTTSARRAITAPRPPHRAGLQPVLVHADRYVPVEPWTDAALALGMCQVIVEEGLADLRFVKEQTDLSLLVRTDNGRFLRAADVEEDGSQEHFDWWTPSVACSRRRATLALGGLDPVLAGTFTVECKGDGKGGENGSATVEAAPVFALLKQRSTPATGPSRQPRPAACTPR